MARDSNGTPPESVISIIGPGMKVIGDCQTDGTIRVEGSVEGSISAGKAVVIGKQGLVTGNIVTQDAVVAGRVHGTLVAESRLELQATCHIEGEIHTRRMQLEEGAVLNGTVHMGDEARPPQLGGAPSSNVVDQRRPLADKPGKEPATAAPPRR